MCSLIIFGGDRFVKWRPSKEWGSGYIACQSNTICNVHMIEMHGEINRNVMIEDFNLNLWKMKYVKII